MILVVATSRTGARLHNLDDEFLLHAELIPSNGVGLNDSTYCGIHAEMKTMWSRHVLQHDRVSKVLKGQHNFAIVAEYKPAL